MPLGKRRRKRMECSAGGGSQNEQTNKILLMHPFGC